MHRIYSAKDFHSAHLLKSILADHGIFSIILNQRDSAYNMIGEEELYVNREDLITALELLRKFEETNR